MRESPHRVRAMTEDVDLALADAANRNERFTPRRCFANGRHGNPEGFGDLGAVDNRDLWLHHGDEWPNHDRRQRRSAWTDVVERAEDATAGEVHAGLLPRLARRGLLEVAIARIHSTAGAGDVTAPRIALDLSALDHKQLRLADVRWPQHQCDGGIPCRALELHRAARMRGEPQRQASDVRVREERGERRHDSFDLAAKLDPAANATGHRRDVRVTHLVQRLRGKDRP